MNRIFKTVWSSVRGCCVAAGENAKSRGKQSRNKLTIAAAAAAMLVGGGAVDANAYDDPGVLGSISSWETSEYGDSMATGEGHHGLSRIHAATAYAEGYTGKGVLIGVVDSGALLSHSELSNDRIFGVTASGTYSKTDTRYPFASLGQTGRPLDSDGSYEKGQSFETNGNWILGINDSHGTHVTSVVAGNRNGEVSHGVAFDADVAVGNTGGTDNMNYGPYQDYNYFYAVWDAVGATGAKVINNSWGTNIRINNSTSEHYNVGSMVPDLDDGTGEPAYGTLAQPEGSLNEYYLFMKDAEANGGHNFMDAAYEVAAKYGLIQIFTNGNRQFQNPYYRAAYAYYNPEAEKYWIAAGGVDVDAEGNEKIMGWGLDYTGTGTPSGGNAYNRSGIAKWWGIAAPTNVDGASVNSATGKASTGKAGGTSNAAPHIAGAMGVLLQRFGSYMDATQVRDVMFTTARQTQYNDPTKLLPGISESEVGAPEDDYGWGIVDLGKAIYGPGQFFGTFDVTMNGVDDQWDNAITESAIVLRGVEDAAEKTELDTAITALKAKDALTDEERWELQYKEKRLAAIVEREKQGYVGKLIKRGDGTLTLTAVNSYTGGTEIYGGTVAGLTESFGSGDVVVENGAAIELHSSFDVTHAGENGWETKTVVGTADETNDDAKIVLKEGATLVLASDGIKIQSLKNEGSATVKALASTEALSSVFSGESSQAVVTATVLNAAELDETKLTGSGYALFDTAISLEGDSALTATLTRNDKSIASFATGSNAAAVGSVFDAAATSSLRDSVLGLSSDELNRTLGSLGSDLHLTMQQATLMSSASMVRTVKDIAADFGVAKTAELENGVRLWATGTGAWMSLDGGSADADTDTYTGYIGADYLYGNDNKLGIFFGYGSTNLDAGLAGKIDSNDLHFGIYGQNNWDYVGLGYGLIYTTQDRDGDRTLTVGADSLRNQVSYDADVTQLFVEASYRGLSNESFSVEPYAGLGYMHVSADSFTEHVGNYAFKTEFDDQDVWTFNLGVRGKKNFTVGDARMAVKGDVAWMQFFGDNQGTARMTIADAGTAQLEGDELNGLGVVSLGIETEIGKSATLGVSYTGAFGSDVTSHGVGATVKILF